jgi:glycosyltransferase involved in cell wall biosynthesis
MYPTPDRPMTGSFVYDQVQALRGQGIDVDVFFVDGGRRTLNYFLGFFRFWRLLLRHWRDYDVIHAHYVLTGVIARAQWLVPLVVTHHGPELLGHPRWQTWLAKLVTPTFDQVIYVSEEGRRALHDHDGWVIPCGVEIDTFAAVPRDEARERLGLAPGVPLVLWANNPNRPEKNFALADQAFNVVKTMIPDAELLVLFNKSHDEMPLYMCAADALLLTSTAEGSPMVIKEAMACNVPIVSVPVGDVPEVIGTTPGCAVVPRDPGEIGMALVQVLRTRQRTDGRTRIDHLRHDRVAARIVDVYRQALKLRRRGRRSTATLPREAIADSYAVPPPTRALDA